MDHAEILKNGGVGVLATDTIYGVVGSALNPTTVERIYAVRKRQPDKPFIILIGSQEQLDEFGIKLTPEQAGYLSSVWPGPVSVVLDCPGDSWSYLHRGAQSLAFRMPNKGSLGELLLATGPLVAPSANPEGSPPANTIVEAQNYFGDTIDFYIDEGEVRGAPSRLVDLRDDRNPTILR